MVELSPSILACNFAHLQEDLDQLKDTDLKWLHLDIMDGIFVPNISFGFDIIKDIREANDLIFDTHLMIEEPIRYVDKLKEVGCDLVTVHYEACKDLDETIKAIKDRGMKVGLTSKPKTDIEDLIPYLKDIDLVLVMSVEPGFGGQSFMEDSLDKVRRLREYIDENKLDVLIEIDGGIKTTNLKKVMDAGVDIVVSGSDVFGKESIKDQVDKYYKIFKE
ncbi:MAG: ribulose-phosphate 3-epimerase [Anaerococcus sp.]|jgi:ribulose-phosphate 3-epimerase|nr:ribulose-phosphate 3-epimerase [Peptoniphilaceae bacterium]MDY3056025.1 ribulose-phosphate 3-epimerase [Anaerococcus sp.]